LTKTLINDASLVLYKIKTTNARRIYAGQKKYELRKVIPRIRPTVVFLYEHNSHKAITGGFFVREVIHLPITKLWEQVREFATTRERFFQYFENWKAGYAFEIEDYFEFSQPLESRDIDELESAFQYPQSFIYLEKHKRLMRKLVEMLDAQYSSHFAKIHLVIPNIEDFKEFKKLALTEVSRNYDDIDKSFIDHIIDCTQKGVDPNGYFTVRKDLFVITHRTEKVGFTVITEKRGGSIKTGPTILLPRFRYQGIGELIRKRIEAEGFRKGARKIYCTCNAQDRAVLKYLLKSGMHIEAHLYHQYRNNSSEIVLGKMLSQTVKQHCAINRNHIKIVEIRDDLGSYLSLFKNFLLRYFETFYLSIDAAFVDSIYRASHSSKIDRYASKGKKVFLGFGRRSRLVTVVICSPKRGGSVKLTLVNMTNHFDSVAKIVNSTEAYCRSKRRTKMYLNIPASDYNMVETFSKLGFLVEGLLQEPYSPGVDHFQLGKMLN
jgi:predicted transcriptional regulator